NLAQQQQLKATGLFAYPWSDFGSDIRSRELDWIKHLLIKANQGLDDASASVSRGMQNSGNPGSHVTPSDLDNLTGGGGDSGGGPSGPARAVITPGFTMCAPGVLCPTINVAPGTSGSGLPSNAMASSGDNDSSESSSGSSSSSAGKPGSFQATESDAAGAKETKPEITIRDHYEHHQNMVDDVKDQLKSQGYRVSNKEVSFGNSCGTGRCRPDIVAEDSGGKMRIFEIKTGDADLSIRQSEIFPQIKDGDAVPRGRVAEDFGLRPGIALKDQGYPNGIQIEVLKFPGAKK
ncbi:hypothetical protein ACQUJT_23265, partial [Ralstonia pseudosolanacearum]